MNNKEAQREYSKGPVAGVVRMMNINGRDLSYTVHARVPVRHLNPNHYVDYAQALAECEPGRTLTIHEKRPERPGSWLMRWVAIGELWL